MMTKQEKEDYKRLKAKENFWAMFRLALTFASIFVYGIMR